MTGGAADGTGDGACEGLGRQLREARVLICVGSGGVGKTTVSAALGLRAALAGRRTLVCTIDPARRLANALGLEGLTREEVEVPRERFAAAGLSPDAPFSALMLDMKRTWDELIERNAPEEHRRRILESRFYRALSTRLAGSQEYIALEKLWQLAREERHDLVILDTPPTAHALDFLEAPGRVLDFLENEAARWLLSSAKGAGKVGLKLFNFGGSFAARTLSRFTGGEMLTELADFLRALSGLNDNFRERAEQVRALLASEKTAFVVVTGPAPERTGEALHFMKLLRESDMQLAALVANRVHPFPDEGATRAMYGLPQPLRDKVALTLDEARALAEQDRRGLAVLTEAPNAPPLVTVPRFDRDVHSIESLAHLAGYLVDEPLEPQAGPTHTSPTKPAGKRPAETTDEASKPGSKPKPGRAPQKRSRSS